MTVTEHSRIEKLREYSKIAGPTWTVLYLARRVAASFEALIDTWLIKIEQRKYLVGDWTITSRSSTRGWNSAYWDHWDWSQRGEEWTASAEWKETLVDNVLRKYIQPAKVILEIGPGAGRWTEYLVPLAQRLILVDVSAKCLDLCRARFSSQTNIDYYQNRGRDLDMIPDHSVDFVWSYDAFVHINPTDTNFYLKELRRVLKPGGRALIHHPGTIYTDPKLRLFDRSYTTKEFFAHLVTSNNLVLEDQLDGFVHLPGDVISIIRQSSEGIGDQTSLLDSVETLGGSSRTQVNPH